MLDDSSNVFLEGFLEQREKAATGGLLRCLRTQLLQTNQPKCARQIVVGSGGEEELVGLAVVG